MKFEKLSMDKFDSHSLSDDLLFKVIGGVKTWYTDPDGNQGWDTQTGTTTTATSGVHNGETQTDPAIKKDAVGIG